MAATGFEGFEKRLELHFAGGDPLGLRALSVDHLTGMLAAVQCTIVSSVADHCFDSYVLSESSLFVFPRKIIIKTCGTTQLLKAIPFLIPIAHQLHGLRLRHCRYSRGTFIFPNSQPFPHTSFSDEVAFLESSLPESLCFRKARVIDGSWHIFSASDRRSRRSGGGGEITVEVCMTQLDHVAARRFYRKESGVGAVVTGHEAGELMTAAAGIARIFHPRVVVCDFGFEPCGYSMNGILAGEGGWYSTIHVTPEEEFSYASFECSGDFSGCRASDLSEMLCKVAEVFRPGSLSVSLCMNDEVDGDDVAAKVADEIEKAAGLKKAVSGTPATSEEFPGAGEVHYLTFFAA